MEQGDGWIVLCAPDIPWLPQPRYMLRLHSPPLLEPPTPAPACCLIWLPIVVESLIAASCRVPRAKHSKYVDCCTVLTSLGLRLTSPATKCIELVVVFHLCKSWRHNSGLQLGMAAQGDHSEATLALLLQACATVHTSKPELPKQLS
jgi:hypothetical protein